MKNCFFLLLLVSAATFGQSFPITKAIPSTITKFNISFQDDYVWLEDMKSETTKNWVNAQNEVCNFHLDEIKKNNNILSKIKEYNAYSSNGLPAKKGAFFYSLYTKEKGKPSVLYYRKAINDDAIALFNPFSIYKNSFAGITDYSPSNNSKFMACKISTDGSDRNEIRFVDIEKLKNLDDVLTNVKFSKIVWNQDTGIFYKRNSNQNNFAKDSTFQLFYHKLGTEQENDKLVFDTSKTGNNFSYFTKKNRLFIIEQNRISDIKNYYFIGLNNNDFVIEPFFESDDSKMTYLHLNNDKIYFSNKEFDWGEIKSFDISNAKVETVIVPQIYNNLLLDTYFEEDYIFCKYKTTVKNYIIAYDQNGKFIRKFDSPEGTDFDFKFFDSKTKDLYISVFSKTISFQNFKLNVASGEANHFYNYYLEPKVTLFPLDYFTTKTTTFKSRDQKEVPITIIYKKGTVLDGKNPTLLEAYGGFGVVSELYYDSALLYFLEKGGVYAFASIRGGGEKGLKWHTDGKGLKKQNTFNDFIDAAEFLISQKYTSPEKLAISGASNGGLVVGVAMTQRPDLFKVAVPKVGVFDMIKFKNYTVGSYWAEEYGNPERKTEFESLLAFSPYHNIREEVNYPITLIITSENDDRVVPMHSYKFAAHLQNRIAQKNPIYIKTFNDAGHNGKISNYNSYFEEKAAFYSFLLYHLNR